MEFTPLSTLAHRILALNNIVLSASEGHIEADDRIIYSM